MEGEKRPAMVGLEWMENVDDILGQGTFLVAFDGYYPTTHLHIHVDHLACWLK